MSAVISAKGLPEGLPEGGNGDGFSIKVWYSDAGSDSDNSSILGLLYGGKNIENSYESIMLEILFSKLLKRDGLSDIISS